jgi:hypothetical protein
MEDMDPLALLAAFVSKNEGTNMARVLEEALYDNTMPSQSAHSRLLREYLTRFSQMSAEDFAMAQESAAVTAKRMEWDSLELLSTKGISPVLRQKAADDLAKAKADLETENPGLYARVVEAYGTDSQTGLRMP